MAGANLFLPQWTRVLLTIARLEPKERYFQRLIRHAGTASSYAREVLRSLEEAEFLEVKRSAHIHRLVLTPPGNQLVYHLAEADRLISRSSGSGRSTSKDLLGTPSTPRQSL